MRYNDENNDPISNFIQKAIIEKQAAPRSSFYTNAYNNLQGSDSDLANIVKSSLLARKGIAENQGLNNLKSMMADRQTQLEATRKEKNNVTQDFVMNARDYANKTLDILNDVQLDNTKKATSFAQLENDFMGKYGTMEESKEVVNRIRNMIGDFGKRTTTKNTDPQTIEELSPLKRGELYRKYQAMISKAETYEGDAAANLRADPQYKKLLSVMQANKELPPEEIQRSTEGETGVLGDAFGAVGKAFTPSGIKTATEFYTKPKAEISNSKTVKIKLPNGKTGTIPADKLELFKKKFKAQQL
jgi:hypothetical protein